MKGEFAVNLEAPPETWGGKAPPLLTLTLLVTYLIAWSKHHHPHPQSGLVSENVGVASELTSAVQKRRAFSI